MINKLFTRLIFYNGGRKRRHKFLIPGLKKKVILIYPILKLILIQYINTLIYPTLKLIRY